MAADNAADAGAKPPAPVVSAAVPAAAPKKYYAASASPDGDVHLLPSAKLKLLHQRTSLSLAYDRERGWGYRGETSMYIVADPPTKKEETKEEGAVKKEDDTKVEGTTDKKEEDKEAADGAPLGADGKPVELAFHLRDGCRVDSVEVFAAARKAVAASHIAKDEDMADADEGESGGKAEPKAGLHPLPHHSVSFFHHDPLSVVMRRPAGMHSLEDDGAAKFEERGEQPGSAGEKQTDSASEKQAVKRYEADAHAARGAKGVTYSLRAASVASAVGELRVTLAPKGGEGSAKPGRIRLKLGGSARNPAGETAEAETAKEAEKAERLQSKEEAAQCWKEDLASSAADAQDVSCPVGETPPGTLEQTMTGEMLRWRCRARREARIDLVSHALAKGTEVAPAAAGGAESKGLSRAMKVVVRFSLRHPAGARPLHMGGITFMAPNDGDKVLHPSRSTPHAYTVAGSFGDHQGVRSWLPTLDSAAPRHRASHELVVKVTARRAEGVWPCAAGEDFGANASVAHPVLGSDANEAVFGPLREGKGDDAAYVRGVMEAERAWKAADDQIAGALGRRHARFVNDFFSGSGSSGSDDGKPSGATYPPSEESPAPNPEMRAQIRRIGPAHVTSLHASLIWAPCPARALGFAVGPFAALYDPEYFRLDDEDADSDSDAEEGADEDGPPLSPAATARRRGEGIRQLYFAPRDDRPWVHADVGDEHIFGRLDAVPRRRPRPQLSTAQLQDRQRLEASVLAATIGVPNRALSLMRDVLALPAYRTAGYTQIWIPDARLSGSNSGGNMVGCPEVEGCNPFLGGAILDGALLPPPGMRWPYYHEGRALQFLQARNAVRGWVRAALPLAPGDDVGQGYLHALVEAFLMSLYERGHGAFGEGGGRGSFFYTKRYAISAGLNSPNLDFLPLVNIEEDEVAVAGGGVGAIAIEERGNEHLWRSANNGTETHTSSLDEFALGQLHAKDFAEALERADKSAVPLPSMGWLGSHQSATFLSHNSASSTALGCGALDFAHPMGGQMYRAVKSVLLSRVYEGRAGISHFTRVVRAAFIASFLGDMGHVSELPLPDEGKPANGKEKDAPPDAVRPPFVMCIDEMIKKQALSHAIFTRALRVMSGPIHEAYLRGNLVDIGRDNYDSQSVRKLVSPEGFPNSYVRGASGLYLRVGAHIEAADGSASGQSASAASQSAAAVKGIHLHVVAEPAIPDGGSAFGGPVTLRVIENEGQCREFVKTIPEDGSRTEWGPLFLHARPVSTAKQQQAASGIADAPAASGGASAAGGTAGGGAVVGGSAAPSSAAMAFTGDQLHRGGFQALELIRITNITPLLWIRVDPHGLYNGRLNIFQHDACLAEQIFHDGDAAAQVEAIRALAERPLKIQGTPKVQNVHDVPISELPVRVLGDCLRGSVALHCDLPHNPAVRAQAALAIAQWQNIKAPESRDVVGGSSWLGLDLLLQYFRERYYCNGVVLPVNFRRCVTHRHIAGSAGGGDTTSDGGYQYLDALADKDDRKNLIEYADEVEIEEDEEYRVRSACVTAIASIRAQDGMTPKRVIKFLEDVLLSGDKAAVGSLLLPPEEEQLKKKQDQALGDEVAHRRLIGPNDEDVSNLPYVSSALVADALLALCYVNARPQSDFDTTAGSSKDDHPILPLMELCLGWLEWELERMRFRTEIQEANLTGIGDGSQSTVAPCAITALCHLALLKQSTTFKSAADDAISPAKRKLEGEFEKAATAQFYMDIFDDPSVNDDSIRAAAAQSVVCICCAADRDETKKTGPLGLLASLEFLLDRILEPISPGLRLTLALLMIDACTGKICSLQRVGSFCGQNTLCGSGSRFMNGPLGASSGGDNGSALLLSVSDVTYPAANAVNDGARQGLRLLKGAGKDNAYSVQTGLRVARFATKLWRTINGEAISPKGTHSNVGICAHDNHLRCTLVALWQWIWPRQCPQVKKAQPLHANEGTAEWYSLGLDHVMKTTKEEEEAAQLEDQALEPLVKVVEAEIDRQKYRGEMAGEAYAYVKNSKEGPLPLTEAGQPLPTVEKDAAWRLGGWVASTAQQRRSQGADGGSAVSKIRLLVTKSASSTAADNPS
ncbi:hypothetical protein ACHAXT_011494 [Thalassiosira profunda]